MLPAYFLRFPSLQPCLPPVGRLFVEQLLYTRYLLSASPLNTCRDCFTWVQTSRRLALCGSTAQTPSYLSSVIYVVVLSLPGANVLERLLSVFVVWGVRRGGCTLPVYADEEAKGQLQASSTALHISLIRQDLLLCLELGISARLDIPPASIPSVLGLQVSISMPRLIWVLGVGAQILCPCSKLCTRQTFSPADSLIGRVRSAG